MKKNIEYILIFFMLLSLGCMISPFSLHAAEDCESLNDQYAMSRNIANQTRTAEADANESRAANAYFACRDRNAVNDYSAKKDKNGSLNEGQYVGCMKAGGTEA